MDQPAYVRIANDLRARIVSGQLAAGTRLPSRQELAVEYDAAQGVISEATKLLTREGLLVSRPGAGMFVRQRPQRRSLVRSWFRERQAGSPFRQQMEEQGRRGSWEYASETLQAPAEVRERLGLGEPDGDRHDVMRTTYTFSSDDEGPWMLSTSWEPLELTKGTPIAWPEAGEHAGLGVTHRMAAIGITVDAWDEEVWARVASPEEAKHLGIGAGSIVMVVERSYFAGELAVETCDIVVPAETTKLVYNGPVGDS
ncbi:GntR family transcriptional regulator [Nonomuraea lactucae]|uniref:GntR family transcriptional regulator n=1 Tax=Nonomuraea lactucae TaxID=2249762 RepID=UPI00196510D8|nr:GntR family transcriptional regulator [Nonomuraea lactucae]